MNLPAPTLALSSDLIIAAIGTIIIVGSWIANALKNMKEEKARQERRQQGGLKSETSTSASQQSSGRQRLEELAAQRRREMQQQAEAQRSRYDPRRGGAAGSGTASGGGASGGREPSNLTMAERIARARAKAQYQQRSEDLRSGSRAKPAEPTDQRRSAEDELAERRRREAQQARQEQAERRKREQQQAQEAERQRKQREAQERQRREERARHDREQAEREKQRRQQRDDRTASHSQSPRSTPSRTPPARQGVGAAGSTGGMHAPRIDLAARHQDVSLTEVGSGLASPSQRLSYRTAGQAGVVQGFTGKLHFDRQSLRDAIIMKEVIDKPVGLRDPQARFEPSL